MAHLAQASEVELSGLPELDWRHTLELLAASRGPATLWLEGPIAGGLSVHLLQGAPAGSTTTPRSDVA